MYDNAYISTAVSAEEAVRVMDQKPVDILITNLKLPRMNGLELTRSIKGVSPDTQSILITAYGSDKISNSAQRCGCLAYLEKPFDIDMLLQYVSMAMEPQAQESSVPENLSLPDVLQLYTSGAKNTVLSIVAPNALGSITIEEGVIVDAKYNKQRDPIALRALLERNNVMIRSIPLESSARQSMSLELEQLKAVLEEED